MYDLKTLYEPRPDETWTEKLISGSVKIPVEITRDKGRLYFQFRYSPPLMEEIKCMEGRKYHGYDKEYPRKIWSAPDSPRNRFQFDLLKGLNPYSWWEQSLVDFKPNRAEVRSHQCQMSQIGLTFHYVEWGAEMGTGKTLAAIETMEQSGVPDWFWVGPGSAINAVKLELKKWDCKIKPILMTYEHFKKVMEGWKKGVLPPHGVVFDEFSRCKNHTTQRSEAAQHVADAIRAEWGNRGFVLGLSGSPAPKSPGDWWSQCEILAPGYLREGHISQFRARLALIEQVEDMPGIGKFPRLVTWWDNENKCQVCGKFEDDKNHKEESLVEGGDFHPWVKSVNQVDFLYRRMKGLVHVFFKKDCLDLPDKQYRLVFCPPSQETLNGMAAIKARSPSAIQALTLMRELSDGFQYKEIPQGTEQCPLCYGNRVCKTQTYVGPDFDAGQLEEAGVLDSSCHPETASHPEWWKEQEGACERCAGTGEVTHYQREAVQVDTPKEEALVDILDEHEDVGRIVIYGGFTGSIDRIKDICTHQGWNVIVVDGRGWQTDLGIQCNEFEVRLLEAFQDVKGFGAEFDKIAFIGQPGSAGMGLTLTASPTIVYFSNDFNAESRIQSEDRIHRMGMDTNLGATIIDLIHLPSDKLILDNLKLKRDLQAMSMGQLQRMLK